MATTFWVPGSIGYVISGFEADDADRTHPNVIPLVNGSTIPQESVLYFPITVASPLCGTDQAIVSVTIKYRGVGAFQTLSLGIQTIDVDSITLGTNTTSNDDSLSLIKSTFEEPVRVNGCVAAIARFSIGVGSQVSIVCVGLECDDVAP